MRYLICSEVVVITPLCRQLVDPHALKITPQKRKLVPISIAIASSNHRCSDDRLFSVNALPDITKSLFVFDALIVRYL